MISNRYNLNIPTSDFVSRFHHDLKDRKLLRLDSVQQNSNLFFFRGFICFKKGWWNFVTRFMYTYLIFDFTIQENNIVIESNWYEGTAAYPSERQNRAPKISSRLLSLETSIHTTIESLIINY